MKLSFCWLLHAVCAPVFHTSYTICSQSQIQMDRSKQDQRSNSSSWGSNRTQLKQSGIVRAGSPCDKHLTKTDSNKDHFHSFQLPCSSISLLSIFSGRHFRGEAKQKGGVSLTLWLFVWIFHDVVQRHGARQQIYKECRGWIMNETHHRVEPHSLTQEPLV